MLCFREHQKTRRQMIVLYEKLATTLPLLITYQE
jgi:hypothetical protein